MTGQIADLLRCPICQTNLAMEDGKLICTNTGCARAGRPFEEVHGKPVLIDPQVSLFDVKAVEAMSEASAIQRRALRQGLLFEIADTIYRWLLPPSPLSASNAKRFRELLPDGGKILVIGGGTRGEGTEALWSDSTIEWIPFDVYASDNVAFVADAHSIPVRDGSFDGVWIQAVLEHVIDPWKVAAEIHRVLKPDGVVYAETPFMQQVHEGGYDFFRFSHTAHRVLFRNFVEIESGAVAGPGTVVVWSVRYFVRAVTGSDMLGRLASLAFFWCRWFDNVGSRRKKLDAASCVYFIGRKASDPFPLETVGTYYASQSTPVRTLRPTTDGARPVP